jgi:hypothetical protein
MASVRPALPKVPTACSTKIWCSSTSAPDNRPVNFPAVVVVCAAPVIVAAEFAAALPGSGAEANNDRIRSIAACASAHACTSDTEATD